MNQLRLEWALFQVVDAEYYFAGMYPTREAGKDAIVGAIGGELKDWVVINVRTVARSRYSMPVTHRAWVCLDHL